MEKKSLYPVSIHDEGLTVVADPGELSEFDLIFVHDFGDGAKRTWATQKFFWPEDHLPAEAPNVRILMYGYPTKKSLSHLQQHGDDLLNCIQEERIRSKIRGRPIVFISHGLGGLIVKNAIISSGNSKKTQRFLANCTRGIIFLGTPHQGTKASLHAKITRIVKHFSAEQRATLPNNRSDLWDRLNAFPHVVEKFAIPVECFYEASNTHPTEDVSATMGRGERTHALNTNHVDMCRFGSSADPNLVCIVATIKRLCTAAKDITKPNHKYAVPIKPPFSRNVNFCGRDETMEETRRRFWPDYLTDDHLAPLTRTMISIQSRDGAGKTQILLEYMYRCNSYKHQYTTIFWLNGDSVSKFETSAFAAVESIIAHYDRIWKRELDKDQRIAHAFKLFEPPVTTRQALADAVGKTSSIELLRTWLSAEDNDRWLLILDNYHGTVDLEGLLPKTETGHVLLSTRDSPPAEGMTLLVPETISEPDSVDLLIRSSGKDPGKISRTDISWANSIIKLIGQRPVALEQAGACILSEKITLQKYFKRIKAELEQRDNENPLCVVWELSFGRLTDGARRLLQMCSLIENDEISLRMLHGGKRDVEWMKPDGAIANAIGDLVSFSFAESGPDDLSISIQPLLHRWVRNRLERERGIIMEMKKLVTYMVTSSFSFEDAKTIDWNHERHIFPHIEKCTAIFETQSDGYGERLDERTREVAFGLARAYDYLSKPEKATEIYRRALKWVKEHKFSIQDVKIMDAFGQNLVVQGLYVEAEEWYMKALDVAMTRVGSENKLTLNLVRHVAALWTAQERYDKAIAEYKKILAVQEKKHAQNHNATLETKRQLALVFIKQGEYDHALELLDVIREAKEQSQTIGLNHSSTLEILGAIAEALEGQGKHTEALQIHQTMLDRKVSVLGENHHSTLTTLSGIADSYARQGLYTEALSTHDKVLSGLTHLFGPISHPWVFRTISDVGHIQLRLGDYPAAEESFRKAYTGLHSLGLVSQSLEVATALGRVLALQGAYTDGLNWARIGESGLSNLTHTSAATMTAKSTLAEILELQGHYPEALELLDQVLAHHKSHTSHDPAPYLAAHATRLNIQSTLFRVPHSTLSSLLPKLASTLGPHHPVTESTTLHLATHLAAVGSYSAALPLAQGVHFHRVSTVGKTHPLTLLALLVLADVQKHISVPDASTGFNTILSTLSESHPNHHIAALGIADLHFRAARYEQAYTLSAECYKQLTSHLGSLHPATIDAASLTVMAGVKTKRVKEVTGMAEATVVAAEKTLGGEHPVTLRALHGRGVAWRKGGKRKEGEKEAGRVLEGRKKVLGGEHEETKESKREERKRKKFGLF